MRILAIADCESDPALEEVVWRRLAGLATIGIEIRALLVRCSSGLLTRLRAREVEARAAAGAVATDWVAVREILGEARTGAAQVLYCHGAHAHTRGSLAGPAAGLPVVAHLLDNYALADAHAGALCRSTCIVATAYARNHALAGGARHAVVVPTPLSDTPDSGSVASRARAHPVIGWAGMLRDPFNPRLFMRAACAALRELPRLQFTMAVGGRLRLPPGFGEPFPDRCSLVPLGFGEASFARDIDICVQTAWQDATHVTLLEAMSHGVPVIATAASGLTEFIDSPAQGRLCRAGDETRLVQAMIDATQAWRPGARKPIASGAPSMPQAARQVAAIIGEAIEHNVHDAAAA